MDSDLKLISESFLKSRHSPAKIVQLLVQNIVTGCTMIVTYELARCLFDLDSLRYLASKEGSHDQWLAALAFGLGATNAVETPLVEYRQHEANVTYAVGALSPRLANPLITFAKNIFQNPKIHQGYILMAGDVLNLHGSRFNWWQRIFLHSVAALRHMSYFIRRPTFAIYRLVGI